MMRQVGLLGLAGLALSAVAAFAQTAAAPPGGPPSPSPPAAAQPAASAAVPVATLPTVEVIGTSPLPGVGVPADELPANVQVLAPAPVTKYGAQPLTTQLNRNVGSVNVNENQDNPYQPDVLYRGFESSPILGTPIGIAVYQNGIRLNEPFGDNVNWDLVPQFAVHSTNVFPTNPVFGLNALGGAIVMDMKTGFNYQGAEADLAGGSFGQQQYTAQYGKQIGNFAAYIGGNAYNEVGFRDFSNSQVRQLYGDIGVQGPWGSLNLDFTGANNRLSGIGPTPIQLVDINRSAVYTSPQVFHNTLRMSSLRGNFFATDTLSFQTLFYVRSATRTVNNGNNTDAQLCTDPSLLCFGDDTTPLIDTSGFQVPSGILGGGIPGELDNSSIVSLGLGGALQSTYTAPLFGHDNHLVVGASLDHGNVDFGSTSELGVINAETLVVSGVGVYINQPDGSFGPVRLETTNSYYGIFASDTFQVTPQFAVTGGLRYNLAQIRLIDELGTALNGYSTFNRVNPAIGGTYKFLPNLTGYFGYATANRAPTAGEIACSDPARPCSLDNFLTSDPPGLQQVVARTYEVGLRGTLAPRAIPGRVQWNFDLFRTNLENDIYNVPSTILNTGYFTNVGGTRRQGIELGITYDYEKWHAYANYSFIQATFQSDITLASPNNPFADPQGNIHVVPGDILPGIPENRLKLGADYQVTPAWSVGGNVLFFGNQYYFGDESNQNSPLPGYIVVNLHSTYQVAKHFQLFAQLQNVFNNDYATYGILGDASAVPLPGVPNPSDPRFVSVAAPIAVFGGLKITF
jgi:iron complex outermembrane recepter protein